jgi:hypothetical protein
VGHLDHKVTILVRNANNTDLDPVEVFQYVSSPFSSNTTISVKLRIESYSGPLPAYLKLVVHGQVTSIQFATHSSISYGHSNASQAAGVGAAYYASTPAFGIVPPLIESFSSARGTPILFTKAGTALRVGNSQSTSFHRS